MESKKQKGELKSTCFALIFALTILFNFNTTALVGENVKFLERIEFSPASELPQKARAFCVTEDGLFIIPDYDAGNIKIYERNGTFLNLVKIIGHKGFGINDLAEPLFCFYNKDEGKFGVMDFGKKMSVIYERIGRIEFKPVMQVRCENLGYDIYLNSDGLRERLFISGYNSDESGNSYDLYYIDLINNQTTFLLPSYQKYGFKDSSDYEAQYYVKSDIKVIGRKGWFDIQGEDVYFAWEGDLRIIKINIKSGELTTFGIKTSHYFKPYKSENMHKAYLKGDPNSIKSEWAKMSYIKNIFASPKYVLVIYEGPNKKNRLSNSNYMLQFYTLEGKFKAEVPIPLGENGEQPGWRINFDKDRNILYFLSNQSIGDEKEDFFITAYKIE